MKRDKSIHCDIGDWIDHYVLLAERLVKCYRVNKESFADTPTMTFKLDLDKGSYVRIE